MAVSGPQARSRAPRRPWKNVEESPNARHRSTILDTQIDAIGEGETIGHIRSALEQGQGGWVIPLNLDGLRQTARGGELGPYLREAEIVVADGMPVIWASRIAGDPLPERVAGSDLIYSVCRMAAEHGYSVFLLGGKPGTAAAAADELSNRYPGLEVAGVLCPPYGFDMRPAEEADVREQVVASGAQIVLVGLGAPKQERLIHKLRVDLPQSWFIGLGISFSFVSNDVPRAPRALQRLGLEWLHRLIHEPGRLVRRYLIQGVPFAGGLFSWALGCRIRSTFGGIRARGRR